MDAVSGLRLISPRILIRFCDLFLAAGCKLMELLSEGKDFMCSGFLYDIGMKNMFISVTR